MRYMSTFKALGTPTRINIVEELLKGDKILTELANSTQKTPQTIDFHLNILIDSGIVKSIDKNGKKYYSLIDKNIVDMMAPKGRGPMRGKGRYNHPKPPHEIVQDEMVEIKEQLNRIEEKLDKLLKK